MKLSPRMVLLGFVGLIIVSITVALVSNHVQAPSDGADSISPNQPQPTRQNEPQKKVNHLSTTFNYELEIPASWEEVAHSSNFYYLKQFRAPDGSQFEILVYENQSNLTAFLAERDLQSQTAWEGYPSVEILEQNQVTIAGYSAITRLEDMLAAGFTAKATYLTVGNNTYSFTIYPSDNAVTEMNNSDVGLSYDQVINTFKIR